MPKHRPEAGKIIIGYAARSGSNLLWWLLGRHSWCCPVDEHQAGPVIFGDQGDPLSPVVIRQQDPVYRYPARCYIDRVQYAVWITRDPRDAYCSAQERWGDCAHWYLPNWVEAHQRLLETWERWLLVRYETLVQHPQPTLRRLQGLLDLPYEDLSRPWQAAPQGGSDNKLPTTRAITPDGVGRWKRELTGADVAQVHAVAGEVMGALGYE